MAVAVKYISSKSEAEIIALTSADPLWYDQGFYYPNDSPVKPYYYRVVNGVMVKYAAGDVAGIGVGITLNDKVMGGIAVFIDTADTLTIPINYDYNSFRLDVVGVVNCEGQINIM